MNFENEDNRKRLRITTIFALKTEMIKEIIVEIQIFSSNRM